MQTLKQPLQEKPAANAPSTTNEQGVTAMEVVSEYQLKHTNTEKMTDDTSLSIVEFTNRFKKFKVDNISIKQAEVDAVFNAKENF